MIRKTTFRHLYFQVLLAIGADAFSFGDGIALGHGDVMEIELTGFGRPLRNPIKINRTASRLVRVKPL